ncbi:MAG: histidinol-phosphate transaminase [Chloroflexi bacterium]|nr:histidinol-phosphate transaminase [Chloroflexota bacterium]
MPGKPRSKEKASSVRELLLPHIARVQAYASVRPPDILEEESGRERGAVKLDANENPYAPTARVREAIAAFPHLNIYPDPEQAHLRKALAEYAGLGPERIVAGAGSDELIDLLVRIFVGVGDVAVTATPTFGMYRFSTQVAGGRLVEVPRDPDDFSLDMHGLLQALQGGAAKIVLLASPNNPTGNTISRREVEALLETGRLVVVDEAYYEFSGESVASLVPHHDNLVVLRTFSKWAGLAGLRVGYGLFPQEVAATLCAVKPPYSVSTLAQAAAIVAVEDRQALLGTVRTLVHDREGLGKALAGLPGARVYPSRANFLLVRFPGRDVAALNRRLRERGIYVRYFTTPGLEDCLRISVGQPEDHRRLLVALREEVKP